MFLTEINFTGVYCNHELLIGSPLVQRNVTLAKLPSRVENDTEQQNSKHWNEIAEDTLKIAWRYSNAPRSSAGSSIGKKRIYDLSKPMSADLLDHCYISYYPFEDFPSPTYQGLWSVVKEELRNSRHSMLPYVGAEKSLLRIVLEGKYFRFFMFCLEHLLR